MVSADVIARNALHFLGRLSHQIKAFSEYSQIEFIEKIIF